jgi:hypothetical protein
MTRAGDTQRAARLLECLESGAGMLEAQDLARDLDPVLFYAVIKFLRETHPASHPAASAVLERVMKLMRADPRLVAKFKTGESDPVAKWFASSHAFRSYGGRGREVIELFAGKLDG